MGSASAPKSPAKKPERIVEVEPEDIQLGGEEVEGTDLKLKGKRALTKPSGGPSVAGLNI